MITLISNDYSQKEYDIVITEEKMKIDGRAIAMGWDKCYVPFFEHKLINNGNRNDEELKKTIYIGSHMTSDYTIIYDNTP